MDQFPVFLNIQHRTVVIVGGGETAAQKLRLVRRARPRVRVVALELCDELAEFAAKGYIEWVKRGFLACDVVDAVLVYAASGIDAVDQAVARAARARGVPVNTVDKPELCDFITPALVDRSPVVVAISSGGAAPILIRNIRAAIDRLLPQNLGALARFADSFRDAVKAVVPAGRRRLRFWERFFEGPVAAKVLAGDESGAREDMLGLVNGRKAAEAEDGVIHIVGAGPGDPELLTIRAQRLLHRADVIVYDKLVGPGIMEMARRDADRIYVGKTKGRHTLPQDEINALLVREAQAGKRVVRLKGGDPFIFGRGGEELDAARRAGIPAEVVPGVTAAAACAAGAGIPLTHRNHASAITFLTGHGKLDEPDLDWAAFARGKQTLAVYMGVGSAARTAERLISHGMAEDMPVAVIENGSRSDQRVLRTRLSAMAGDVSASGIAGPAIILIGHVAAEHMSGEADAALTATAGQTLGQHTPFTSMGTDVTPEPVAVPA